MAADDVQQPATNPPRDDETARRDFAIVLLGAILVALGSARGCLAFLWTMVEALSWPLEGVGFAGMLFALAALILVPKRLIWGISRTLFWIVVAFWLLSCSGTLARFLLPMYGWDQEGLLNMMITVIGLLLIGSADSRPRIVGWMRRAFTMVASFFRAHVKGALIAWLLVLWLFNPIHSHETCLQASTLAENLGAYGTAIVFTELARDVFHPRMVCGTCWESVRFELTFRIVRLERKRTGQDVHPIPPDGERRNIGEVPRNLSWVAAQGNKP
jgi:hypothetical protein